MFGMSRLATDLTLGFVFACLGFLGFDDVAGRRLRRISRIFLGARQFFFKGIYSTVQSLNNISELSIFLSETFVFSYQRFKDRLFVGHASMARK